MATGSPDNESGDTSDRALARIATVLAEGDLKQLISGALLLIL